MTKRKKPSTKARKKKGVLTGLAKSAPSKKRKGRPTGFRKILNWAVGIAVGAVVLGVVVLYAALSFNPKLQEQSGEAEVTVEAVEPDPAGFPDDIIAAARVTLEGRPVLVPLTAERRDEVEAGARLHLRYVFFPQTGSTRIDEWTLVP